jgi:hypothetical protein
VFGRQYGWAVSGASECGLGWFWLGLAWVGGDIGGGVASRRVETGKGAQGARGDPGAAHVVRVEADEFGFTSLHPFRSVLWTANIGFSHFPLIKLPLRFASTTHQRHS